VLTKSSMINYALRIIEPVLKGTMSTVEIKHEAEKSYVYRLQAALRKRVWMAGCNSVMPPSPVPPSMVCPHILTGF